MKTIANIFWYSTQNRLRSGWRLLVHLVLFIAITVGRDVLASAFDSALLPTTFAFLIYLAAGLGLTWWLARSVDRRSFADFGFHFDRRWWWDVIFGLALGALMMTGIFLSMRAAGWVVVTGFAVTNSGLPFILAFLLKVIAFAFVAINEELAFRGYQIKNLAEGFAGGRVGPRAAILLAFLSSSAFFGLTHMGNDNATVYSTLTVLLAGLSLCLPYLLTGELGIPIGLHLTWNLFEGPVYGFAVSGAAPSTHLFAIQQTGPTVWTGGSFGPEVGLIGLVWALVGCGLTVLWVKWLRKKVELHTPLAAYTPRAN
jgi:membrane protease YdiL (CAAX protease family)